MAQLQRTMVQEMSYQISCRTTKVQEWVKSYKVNNQTNGIDKGQNKISALVTFINKQPILQTPWDKDTTCLCKQYVKDFDSSIGDIVHVMYLFSKYRRGDIDVNELFNINNKQRIETLSPIFAGKLLNKITELSEQCKIELKLIDFQQVCEF